MTKAKKNNERKGLNVEFEKSTTPNSHSIKKRVTISLEKPGLGKSNSYTLK